MSIRKRLPPGTSKRAFQFPPDIFWISPDGIVVEVIGHLSSLQQSPETFGLAAAPRTKKEIDDAFRVLWAEGWIRGRVSGGTVSFQMERPRGIAIGAAHDFVVTFLRFIQRVVVDFTGPYPFKDFVASDFAEQRFPASWGLNPRWRGRGGTRRSGRV